MESAHLTKFCCFIFRNMYNAFLQQKKHIIFNKEKNLKSCKNCKFHLQFCSDTIYMYFR